VNLDRAVAREEQPELVDARPSVQPRLDKPIEADRRVGDLDGQQDVLGSRMLAAVGNRTRAQQEQVRLRLRSGADDNRILRERTIRSPRRVMKSRVALITQPECRGPIGDILTISPSISSTRSSGSRMLDLGHAVILVDGEQTSRDLGHR
jgi:hypothetical protein